MGRNRKFRLVASDDEDEQEQQQNKESTRRAKTRRMRKAAKLSDDEDYVEEEEEEEEDDEEEEEKNEEGEEEEGDGDDDDDEEEEVPVVEDAKPVGDAVRVSGKGRNRKTHYEGFEFDGNEYKLEDPVLLTPEGGNQKPYVAIIKDITQTKDGSVFVKGQWFYRPEEAEKRGGGSWQPRDTRELFYSFHHDEVPAESVMHRCVVHFIPMHKQLPSRKQYPGFIVQKVYEAEHKRLYKLTDKDYEDDKQQELEQLVQKTLSRLGDLPDIETEALVPDADHVRNKRLLRKRNVSPLDVSKSEEPTASTDHHMKETPGSCPSSNSEYYAILVKFGVTTGDSHRDRWLEKLLEAVQHVCHSSNGVSKDDEVKNGSEGIKDEGGNRDVDVSDGCGEKKDMTSSWPDSAVQAISALEKASHEMLSSDFQKYNQKMRSMVFNLKKNALLARRLLNAELGPSRILNMSPNELKEGLTVEERGKKEPDESECMQMTDARCERCSQFKVGVREIIQAGHGDRYQLECIACGHSWYASRDEASTLTIEGPGSTSSVGTAPWATSKFDEVEKKLANPPEPEKADQICSS